MIWTVKTDLTKKYAGSRASGNMVSSQDMRCHPITQGRSWGHSSSPQNPTHWASPSHQADLTPRALPTHLAPSARASLLFGPSVTPNLLQPQGLCSRCCPGLECLLPTHPRGSALNPSSLCSDAVSQVGHPFPPFPYWPLHSSPTVPTRHPWMPTLHHITYNRKSLAGYSPWGCKELDTTERLAFASLQSTASI